jgi:hypothetical protein
MSNPINDALTNGIARQTTEDDLTKALYDTALLDRAVCESTKSIPPMRPAGYGILASELAAAKSCGESSARKWLKQNGWKSQTMRYPSETGKMVHGQVFTPE